MKSVQKKEYKPVYRVFPRMGIFFVIGCTLLFLHCAYLNTFYNAKTAFNKTFKAHMKLRRMEADTTNDLPDEIQQGYDRVIAKSTKILEVYPKRRKRHDDASFLKAKATYYKSEFASAIRRFKQFQKEYQNSPFIPESYLLLGKAYLEENYLEKAEEIFQLILEKYTRLNNNEEITLLMAQVAIKREGKSQAIRILEESLRSVKSDERKLEIILKLCPLYIDLKLYDKAIALIKKAPRNKDLQNYLFQIVFNLLICYKKQEEYTKALALTDKMLKNNQYVKQIPRLLMEKGIILKEMGQIEEAVKIFEEVAEGDGTNAVKGSAWYELACIYQHEFGDFEKAKECYEKVVSLSSNERIVDIANTRIQGIDQRLEYLNKIESIGESGKEKSSDTTENKNLLVYKLGEIYWLNLHEPDSALQIFYTIFIDTLADSALMMKSLYASAWILRYVKEDTVVADSLCTIIIKNYPATIVAQKAQQDLGVPVTVQTREDSAQLAFIEAERLFFNKNDAVAAVNAYYKISRKYTDLPEIASNSIYASAWLCDNILHKNKKALMLYRKLCDSFPESELCLNEAKPRIKIVEDTLKVLEMTKKKKGKKKIAEKETVTEEKDTTLDVVEDELLVEEDKDTADTMTAQPPSLEQTIKTPKKSERQKIIRKRRPRPDQ